jgi:serine/threonine-protein kinase HipA
VSEPIEVELETATGTVHVGRAYVGARRGSITTNLTYDDAYLALPWSYAIDPEVPITRGSHAVRGLPGAFADASPDRWGRHIISKRLQAISRRDAVSPRTLTDRDFLLGVSDLTRQGALRFRIGDGPHLSEGTDVPKLVQLPELRQAARDVERNPDDLSALKVLLDAGTGSLGGARPKASIKDGDRLALAKFTHQGDQWRVIAWEAATLMMARLAGIDVPTHHLVQLSASDPVLVVDRFDRDDTRRIGYVSAMTMLRRRDGDSADYLDFLDVIDENSEDPRSDRAELFRRICFNIVVNNTDDHLRNHGFVRGRNGWRISPAFDINPNPDPGAERGTAIDGAVTREDAMTALLGVSDFFVDREQRDAIASSVVQAVSTWRAAADACDIPGPDTELFAPLLDALPVGLSA